jgi:hypothetical protein
MRKILCSLAVVVFLACLASFSYGAIVLRIGNKDGFGFDPEFLEDKVGTTGLPADTNGNGKLEPGEFLPDLDEDGVINKLPPEWGGDGFDNRSEKEGMATNGAQFTDVTFDPDKDPKWIRMFEVLFTFDVSLLAGLPLKSAKLKLIYADFDGSCPDPLDPSAPHEPTCVVCNEIYADGEPIGEVPLTECKNGVGRIGRATFNVPVALLEDGSVTISFESGDSIVFDAATLKIRLALENVKPLVRLRKLSERPETIYMPGGSTDAYIVTYRMRNKSTRSIWAPFIKFKPKSPGILLLNADGGPGGKGATFTPDVGPDVALSPDERVTFDLVIGLTEPDVPEFKLKILGIPFP